MLVAMVFWLIMPLLVGFEGWYDLCHTDLIMMAQYLIIWSLSWPSFVLSYWCFNSILYVYIWMFSKLYVKSYFFNTTMVAWRSKTFKSSRSAWYGYQSRKIYSTKPLNGRRNVQCVSIGWEVVGWNSV